MRIVEETIWDKVLELMREELTKHVLNVVSAMAYLNQEIESLFFILETANKHAGYLLVRKIGKKDQKYSWNENTVN